MDRDSPSEGWESRPNNRYIKTQLFVEAATKESRKMIFDEEKKFDFMYDFAYSLFYLV